jgi:hypothetical protein
MGLSLKKKVPNTIAEKAGMSIWNCRSNVVPGLANPPFRYTTRSTSQAKPKASPRYQPTCDQFTFDVVVIVITVGCDVVSMIISLSIN